MPRLSVIIPTLGRDTLRRTLESVRDQVTDDDEIVVATDFVGQPAIAEAIVNTSLGDRCAWSVVTADGAGRDQADIGYTARNVAIRHATGTHLAFLDDDDVSLPRSLAAMRAHAADVPTIFRMINRVGDVAWQTELLAFGNVGTPCILVPNDPDRLGKWEPWPASHDGKCGGDFAFLVECVDQMGDPIWRDEIVAFVRPAIDLS